MLSQLCSFHPAQGEEEITFNAFTRANLEFPLSRHDLGIDTGNLDTSVQTCFVVCLHNVSAEDLAGADTAVVWTLGSWKPPLWPSVWPSVST